MNDHTEVITTVTTLIHSLLRLTNEGCSFTSHDPGLTSRPLPGQL